MADDDDQNVPHFATARPPPGEEDVYSASTVASEASDEMLAIIRGESQRAIPAAPGVPKNLKIDPKSEPKIALKADAKPEPSATAATDNAVTKPPPPLVKPPTPAAGAPASKLAYTATPLEVPVTALTPTSEPPKGVEIAPDPDAIDGEKAEAEAEANAKADAAADAEERAEGTAIKKHAPKDDDANARKGALHPAVGIVLFFVAVFAVLAALIR